MKIITFEHTTDEIGECVDGGAVHTDGALLMSMGDGCGDESCHCSGGHWVTITAPRDELGKVKGISARFDNAGEMLKFLREHQLVNTKNINKCVRSY
jgi:hypothetical protein